MIGTRVCRTCLRLAWNMVFGALDGLVQSREYGKSMTQARRAVPPLIKPRQYMFSAMRLGPTVSRMVVAIAPNRHIVQYSSKRVVLLEASVCSARRGDINSNQEPHAKKRSCASQHHTTPHHTTPHHTTPHHTPHAHKHGVLTYVQSSKSPSTELVHQAISHVSQERNGYLAWTLYAPCGRAAWSWTRRASLRWRARCCTSTASCTRSTASSAR